MNDKIKTLIRRMFSLLPAKEDEVFVSLKKDNYGPNVFSGNLIDGLKKRGYIVSNIRYRGGAGAIFIAFVWGDFVFDICKKSNTKLILRVDGFYPPEVINNTEDVFMNRDLTLNKIEINQRMQKAIYYADHVVFQTDFSKKMVEKYLYRKVNNCSIIMNGTDIDNFKPVEHSSGWITLLIAGNIKCQKIYIIVALRAINQLIKKYPLRLKIIGPMDDDTQKLINTLCETNESLDCITTMGQVNHEELPKHMANADIYLHPKVGDWCPNTVVESLACGLAVVAPSYGGAAEIVADAGVIVQWDKWEYDEQYIKKYVEGVEHAIQNMEELKVKARKRAVEYFSNDMMVDKYVELLK